jgi:hypothetical protein
MTFAVDPVEYRDADRVHKSKGYHRDDTLATNATGTAVEPEPPSQVL